MLPRPSVRFGVSTLAVLAFGAAAEAQIPSAPPAKAPAAQNSADTALPDENTDDDVVITGKRERGAVIGDVKPLQQFNAGDIRALGVSSINDLMTELGPQVQSASGKPPVMLLEGHRLSSPLEIASLPSEAIQRVDVLPEEVGLKYGYGADQKVVNIVLRERFRAFTAELASRIPTKPGGLSANGNLGFMSINNGNRLNLGAELRAQKSLQETERGLNGPDSAYRTLLPSNQQLKINGTYHRSLADRLSGTLNAEITTDETNADIGRALNATRIPGGTPYASGTADSVFFPKSNGIGALKRASSRQTEHAGFSLIRDHPNGQITLTGSYDHSFSRSLSDQPFNLASYAAAVAAGDPSANPANDIAPQYLVGGTTDVSRSITDNGSLDLLYNTSLVSLKGGDISLTAHLYGSTLSFNSSRLRNGLLTPSRVHRDIGGGSANLSIPVAGRGTALADAIGPLTANFDASLDHLSDAGTIHSFGFGINWQPAKIVSVTGNITQKQSAPTPQQLGDAPVTTSNIPIFDYLRGETASVTTISGGNPNLAKAETTSFRLGVSVAPLKDPDVNLSIDLTQNRTKGGISSMPGITLDTQTAFATRFIRAALDPNDPRDDDQTYGRLTQVDLRPINIREQESTQIRWGINFNKQLKTPQRDIQAFQEVARRRIQERIARGDVPPEVAARISQALQQGALGGTGGPNGRPQGQPGAAPQAGATTQQGGAQQPANRPNAGAANGNATPPNGAPVIIIGGDGIPGGGPPPQGGTFIFGGPGGNFTPPPGGFRGPPGGFGGFGGGGGGGGQQRGGRINLSIYHTWTLNSTIQLADTLPVLDQLKGGTLGGGAGPAEHQLQIQAGYTQSGIGFRMFTNWSSATRSIGTNGSPSSNLRFGSLATVNFRVFMNFSQKPKLVDKFPFLRGSRLVFGANNLFDARQKVTDGTGITPYAYSGAFLDRIGRSVSIEFRKQFF